MPRGMAWEKAEAGVWPRMRMGSRIPAFRSSRASSMEDTPKKLQRGSTCRATGTGAVAVGIRLHHSHHRHTGLLPDGCQVVPDGIQINFYVCIGFQRSSSPKCSAVWAVKASQSP